MNPFFLLLLLLVLFSACGKNDDDTPSYPNLIVNGDFEAPLVFAPNGWTAVGPYTNYQQAPSVCPGGGQSMLALNRGNGAEPLQTLYYNVVVPQEGPYGFRLPYGTATAAIPRRFQWVSSVKSAPAANTTWVFSTSSRPKTSASIFPAYSPNRGSKAIPPRYNSPATMCSSTTWSCAGNKPSKRLPRSLYLVLCI